MESQALLVFSGIKSANQALDVWAKYGSKSRPIEEGSIKQEQVLAISRQNFFNLYKTQALAEYRDFFRESYVKGNPQ